jgi:hypothetical protein
LYLQVLFYFLSYGHTTPYKQVVAGMVIVGIAVALDAGMMPGDGGSGLTIGDTVNHSADDMR